MRLTEHIAAVRAGQGDPHAMLGEFRRTPVLLPHAEDGLRVGAWGGFQWIYAFTGEERLARFVVARGARPDAPVAYRSVLGARLLDAVVPSLDAPTGVALDVDDEAASMLFPPVRGIVPEGAAVDSGEDTTAREARR
ncbi:hypothetical protein [Streptomyces chumphonensis]|uniref:hypothetical protein n=1 Tax=Streptomyces chumphonensis TaxID=1214925 RepID=UPI003D75CD92